MNQTDRSGVVVGVDGSEHSKQALAWAVRWAKLQGEPLVAVAVWHFPVAWGWAVPVPDDYDPEAAATRMVGDVVTEVLGEHPEVEIRTEVVSGQPANVLVDQSSRAALVVVGSRGHGEFAGMLLGSVSTFVVTHAHCPVVVVRDD
ncbi:MAG TPA: universal stress protein [Acidimicrobiales bacterium]|nr:universal stress protein [Acidimicrobiales bacterium]